MSLEVYLINQSYLEFFGPVFSFVYIAKKTCSKTFEKKKKNSRKKVLRNIIFKML